MLYYYALVVVLAAVVQTDLDRLWMVVELPFVLVSRYCVKNTKKIYIKEKSQKKFVYISDVHFSFV